MKLFIKKLDACLDDLLARRNEKQSKQKVYGEEIFKELDLMKKYKELCDLYSSLSDPDALRLIPKMVEVFDGEKKKIHDMTFPNIAKEEALLVELSRLRKQLGFDERERKIRHKRS